MSILEEKADNKVWSARPKLQYEINIVEIRWIWNFYPFAYYNQFLTFVTSKVGHMSILEKNVYYKIWSALDKLSYDA